MPPFPAMNTTGITTDTFFNGRIHVKQTRAGYRYSIDAVILAYYAGDYHSKKILDLGTGCGIIPLILAYRDTSTQIYGVEVQAPLAMLSHSVSGTMVDLYLATKASKEYPFQLVRWSHSEAQKMRQAGYNLWDSIAAKSPRNAKLVEMVRAHMRSIGKM